MANLKNIINSGKKKDDTCASLKDLLAFYENLNTNETNESDLSDEIYQNAVDDDEINSMIDIELNQQITQEEIIAAINTLNNNKASGSDKILNEHLKATMNQMLPIYVKLFNLIFNIGIIPESCM